mmetsp:Transcript_13703/g.43809  ORF Transcript_13703/g.43809 Transcript_13703/m.43809 type:complete len:230 (-) Transcript_13703:1154-1843(-)
MFASERRSRRPCSAESNRGRRRRLTPRRLPACAEPASPTAVSVIAMSPQPTLQPVVHRWKAHLWWRPVHASRARKALTMSRPHPAAAHDPLVAVPRAGRHASALALARARRLPSAHPCHPPPCSQVPTLSAAERPLLQTTTPARTAPDPPWQPQQLRPRMPPRSPPKTDVVGASQRRPDSSAPRPRRVPASAARSSSPSAFSPPQRGPGAAPCPAGGTANTWSAGTWLP